MASRSQPGAGSSSQEESALDMSKSRDNLNEQKKTFNEQRDPVASKPGSSTAGKGGGSRRTVISLSREDEVPGGQSDKSSLDQMDVDKDEDGDVQQLHTSLNKSISASLRASASASQPASIAGQRGSYQVVPMIPPCRPEDWVGVISFTGGRDVVRRVKKDVTGDSDELRYLVEFEDFDEKEVRLNADTPLLERSRRHSCASH